MIPILYAPGTKDYTSNGMGGLSEAISCTVTEERNGEFELEMQYPITGERYKEITVSAIIKAAPGDGRGAQGFRIYKITKPINGIVTVYAEHISYQLSSIPVQPFSAASAAEALTGLKDNAVVDCPFEFWTDKTTEGNFSVTEPASIRSRLGGVEGSILDLYKGEYEFDNYTVRLWNKRGSDKGVTVSYGKNLTDLTQEENISNTITGVMPYWKSEEALVMLPEKVILSEKAENFPYPRIATVDFSSEFDEQPTEEQLRSKANEYISQTGIGVPSISIKISFQPLWQTEEYKDIAPLERVGLCDDITVRFEKLGVSATAEVIKTSYNVLLDRYDSVELGEAKTNLASDLVYQQQEINQKPSRGFLEDAVNNATNWITNGGGYIVGVKDGNGDWTEICSLDQKGIETARKVWRWNNGGFGFSSSGYGGPYRTAITQDGVIVADFIKAGVLQGIEIIAELGKIAGWSINSQAIYKDATKGDGTIYRVYFQPPLQSAPEKTWVLSCQESKDGGKTFTGRFILYSDGSAKFGDLVIDGTNIAFGDTQEKGLAISRTGLSFFNNGKNVAAFSTQEDGGTISLGNGQLQAQYINGYRGYTGTISIDGKTISVGGGIIYNVQ